MGVLREVGHSGTWSKYPHLPCPLCFLSSWPDHLPPAGSQTLASLPLGPWTCYRWMVPGAHWATTSTESPRPADGHSLSFSSSASPNLHDILCTSYPISQASLPLANDLEQDSLQMTHFPSPPTSNHLSLILSSSPALPEESPSPNSEFNFAVSNIPPVSNICNLFLSTHSFLRAS